MKKILTILIAMLLIFCMSLLYSRCVSTSNTDPQIEPDTVYITVIDTITLSPPSPKACPPVKICRPVHDTIHDTTFITIPYIIEVPVHDTITPDEIPLSVANDLFVITGVWTPQETIISNLTVNNRGFQKEITITSLDEGLESIFVKWNSPLLDIPLTHFYISKRLSKRQLKAYLK